MLQSLIHRHITPNCALCGQKLAPNDGASLWCASCLTMLHPAPHCRRCGLPTAVMQPHCGQCLTNPPPWQRIYHLGHYQPPLSHLIGQMKFHHQFWLANSLAPLLASTIESPAPLLLSVPLHWRRFVQRGYNQSHHLALALEKSLPDSRYQPKLFERCRHTPYQRKLDRKARLTNLEHAFRLREKPHQKHVAIVDDVVTTGSTVRQLCQLLLDVEVEKIDIYCLSRTPEQPI
ncbi:phosphoribosyltransferase family protein [Vibrio sp. SCSIO 43136]|uniref:ComF family protein n=1 Tax=Vibrio sp. SCSIO 43136 TaxID=2819101 RepID=UPI002075E469|nr:phosphoribosyltransferase family protein [Vibrio sp. SCSIO 43136]USD65175.1 ComF family protein [Vibrio sp. SCSIO 43136]